MKNHFPAKNSLLIHNRTIATVKKAGASIQAAGNDKRNERGLKHLLNIIKNIGVSKVTDKQCTSGDRRASVTKINTG